MILRSGPVSLRGGMSELSWQRERLEHNRLARAQRGDEDAFAQLTAPYRP